MNRFSKLFLTILVVILVVIGLACSTSNKIEIKEVSKDKIDILVDGKLFTSYQKGKDGEKPIFFPVNSPKGNMINRGWPMMEDVPDEAPKKERDHVHHQSFSYTYGNVNGLDFWAEPQDSSRNGKIIHRELVRKVEKGSQAELELTADWVTPDGKILLKENKIVVIHAATNYRAIDLTITLTAQDTAHFGDTKEGMFGIRVTPSLKDKNEASGYINNKGQKGAGECWGQRAEWVTLQGPVKDEVISVGIFVHPSSINFPPYWHARDYGLFTANPFGRKMYTKGKEAPLELTLKPGENFTFKARLMIQGKKMTKAELDQEYQNYLK